MCIDAPRIATVLEVRTLSGERTSRVEREMRASPRDCIRMEDERSTILMGGLRMYLNGNGDLYAEIAWYSESRSGGHELLIDLCVLSSW